MIQLRAGDSLGDGALIGLAVGGVGTSLACLASTEGPHQELVPPRRARLRRHRAGIGVGIDALIPGKKRVAYRALVYRRRASRFVRHHAAREGRGPVVRVLTVRIETRSQGWRRPCQGLRHGVIRCVVRGVRQRGRRCRRPARRSSPAARAWRWYRRTRSRWHLLKSVPLSDGAGVVALPPRNEPNDFYNDLGRGRDDLKPSTDVLSDVDPVGEDVLADRVLRLDLNGCRTPRR